MPLAHAATALRDFLLRHNASPDQVEVTVKLRLREDQRRATVGMRHELRPSDMPGSNQEVTRLAGGVVRLNGVTFRFTSEEGERLEAREAGMGRRGW